MITKAGAKIPFSRERGLYFLPTDKDTARDDHTGAFVNNLSAARPVDESTMQHGVDFKFVPRHWKT